VVSCVGPVRLLRHQGCKGSPASDRAGDTCGFLFAIVRSFAFCVRATRTVLRTASQAPCRCAVLPMGKCTIAGHSQLAGHSTGPWPRVSGRSTARCIGPTFGTTSREKSRQLRVLGHDRCKLTAAVLLPEDLGDSSGTRDARAVLTYRGLEPLVAVAPGRSSQGAIDRGRARPVRKGIVSSPDGWAGPGIDKGGGDIDQGKLLLGMLRHARGGGSGGRPSMSRSNTLDAKSFASMDRRAATFAALLEGDRHGGRLRVRVEDQRTVGDARW